MIEQDVFFPSVEKKRLEICEMIAMHCQCSVDDIMIVYDLLHKFRTTPVPEDDRILIRLARKDDLIADVHRVVGFALAFGLEPVQVARRLFGV